MLTNVMRTTLFFPGNNTRFIAKAPTYGADIVTFDIEDAVPAQEKENARRITAESLSQTAAVGSQVFVRVNGWHTQWTNGDLEAVVRPGLNGIILPKPRNADDVKRLDSKIAEMERLHGMPEGSVKMSVMLETALGIMNAYEICTASERLVAAYFGAVDYCADMRVKYTNMAAEQQVARSIAAIAARSAGLAALDAPFADYTNMSDFMRNTMDGINMGYEGRIVIHPSQVAIANQLYSPSDEEVDRARQVKRFFEEEGLAKGLASVSFNGSMVDTPVYTAACELVERFEIIQGKEARRG